MSSVTSHPSGLFDSSSSANPADEGSRLTKKQNSELKRIHAQIKVYKAKVANEKKRVANINENIIQHELKELEEKRRVGSDRKIADLFGKIETEKNIYIDRLNKKLVQLNTKISQNKELRRKIDEMRQERCRYDEIYTKLEYDIQGHADTMAQVLEEGKATIKQRDKALCEFDALTKHLEESKSSLRLEQDELKKLEEQFKNEGDEQNKCVERGDVRPPTTAQKTEEKQKEEEFDDEKALDEALHRVFELTGINDVDVLIKRLTQTEEIHFGLFKTINELEAEASKNETRLSDAGQELKKLKTWNNVRNHIDGRRKLTSMEDKRKQLEAKSHDVELQCEEQLKTWNNVRNRIMAVHSGLGLSVPEDLIGTNDVTENNVMQYLAAIENKAVEILTEIHGDYEDQDSNETWLSMANDNDDNVAKTQMDLPSATTGERSELEDEDDGERPFTIEELQESVYA